MSNVPSGLKPKASKMSTGSIDQYFKKETSSTPTSNKCLCSVLSLAEEEKSKKKAMMSTPKESNEHDEQATLNESNNELKNIIGPLEEEMKLLRESVHHDIQELQNAVLKQQEDFTKLKESLTESQKEIKNFFTVKIELNTRNIKLIMENRPMNSHASHIRCEIVNVEALSQILEANSKRFNLLKPLP